MTSDARISRSPYVIGAGLGLLNTLAFATAKRGLGITTAFESVAALGSRRVAPDATRVNRYLMKREELPSLGWEAYLVAGVAAGSFLAARASGESGGGPVVPALWRHHVGGGVMRRLATAFIGGAMMMFGARMAKGCTSGHALTGASQLAVSSWVFTPIMFACATLVTRALYPKEAR